MARNKSTATSLLEAVSGFIERNPRMAIAIAFELGQLAGEFTRKSAAGKTLRKQVAQQVAKIPDVVSDAVPRLPSSLKFLTAPKLQPKKKPTRPSRARSVAH